MKIQTLQSNATKLLPNSQTARLDLELILAEVLKKSREYLYSYPEYELTAEEQKIISKLIKRRAKGEPVAYILGKKEFWSLELIVDKNVLIPRPDTEILVETVLNQIKKEKALIADLGTGSGAVALALAYTHPEWQLIATDSSQKALAIAKRNAKNLKIKNIKFFQGNWCEALPKKEFTAIISNPPYIRKHDPHLDNLEFEPQNALVSGEDGLDAIREIIRLAPKYLAKDGVLILEHGFDQHQKIKKLLQQAGFKNIKSVKDLAGHYRVILGNNYHL